MYVRLNPSRSLNVPLASSRSLTMSVQSASTAFHALAVSRAEATMCSAVRRRMFVHGTSSSRPVISRCDGSGLGACSASSSGAGSADAAGLAAGFDFPVSTYLRTSCLRMRPPVPVPSTSSRLTPCSSASLRTSGEMIPRFDVSPFWPFEPDDAVCFSDSACSASSFSEPESPASSPLAAGASSRFSVSSFSASSTGSPWSVSSPEGAPSSSAPPVASSSEGPSPPPGGSASASASPESSA